MDLDAHRGEHRLFLIFAASPRDENFVDQNRLLEGSDDGFAERDLLKGALCEYGTESFDGSPILPGEVARERERFGVEPGAFAALLVGKDGTVKHRFDEPAEPARIYALVDAMPMRRREMRERGEG